MSSSQQKNLRHTDIVAILGKRVVNGFYAEGTKLPTEQELCKEFSISRPVWREALRVLAAKGLIYSKPRLGTLVCVKSDWHILDFDVIQWIIESIPNGDFFHTLITVRKVLEPEMSALAATYATKKDLENIQSAYLAMEHAKNMKDFNLADLNFHLNISLATHNDVLIYIFKMLTSALEKSISMTGEKQALLPKILVRHKALLVAIMNKDALAAKHASIVHLQSTETVFDTNEL